jgi:hypothetical protein
MTDWNLIATIVVFIGIGLFVITKWQKITLMELLGNIKEFFSDKKELVTERAVEVYE